MRAAVNGSCVKPDAALEYARKHALEALVIERGGVAVFPRLVAVV